jgi:hypothetical protein
LETRGHGSKDFKLGWGGKRHLRTLEREQGKYEGLLLNQQVKLPHSHKYSLDLREMFSRVFLEPLLNNMSSDGGQVNPCYPNQTSRDGIMATIVCDKDAARGFAVQPDLGYHIDALRTQSLLTGVSSDQYQFSRKQQMP